MNREEFEFVWETAKTGFFIGAAAMTVLIVIGWLFGWW